MFRPAPLRAGLFQRKWISRRTSRRVALGSTSVNSQDQSAGNIGRAVTRQWPCAGGPAIIPEWLDESLACSSAIAACWPRNPVSARRIPSSWNGSCQVRAGRGAALVRERVIKLHLRRANAPASPDRRCCAPAGPNISPAHEIISPGSPGRALLARRRAELLPTLTAASALSVLDYLGEMTDRTLLAGQGRGIKRSSPDLFLQPFCRAGSRNLSAVAIMPISIFEP